MASRMRAQPTRPDTSSRKYGITPRSQTGTIGLQARPATWLPGRDPIVTSDGNLAVRGRVYTPYCSPAASWRRARVRAIRGSRWQKGHPAVSGDIGFCEFYQANYAGLVTLVTALLGDRNEAQDVAQEAFARAYTRWPAVGRYELPQAWVRKVAVRIAIDSTRRIRRVGRLSERLITQQRAIVQPPADAISPSLGDALLRLPVREREVLVLHYLADLPVDAIARERGLAAGTVKARLAAGRRRLERELDRQAKAVPDAG